MDDNWKLYGEWNAIAPDYLEMTNEASGRDLLDRTYLLEVPVDHCKRNSGITCLQHNKLNSDTDLTKVLMDTFFDVIHKMADVLGDDASAAFDLLFSQGRDESGRNVTFRYWLVCKWSLGQLQDAGAHPGAVCMGLANAIAESAKAAKKPAMGKRGRSTLSHLELNACMGIPGWGPFIHDGGDWSWMKTCTTPSKLQKVLCAALGMRFDAMPIGEEMFCHAFRVANLLGRSRALGVDLFDTEFRNGLRLHSDRFDRQAPDAHVYRYGNPAHFTVCNRARILVPTAFFYLRENTRHRLLMNMHDEQRERQRRRVQTVLSEDDFENDADDENHDAVEDTSHMSSAREVCNRKIANMKVVYGDEYGLKKGSDSIIVVNKPQAMMQSSEESRHIMEYALRNRMKLGMPLHEFVHCRRIRAFMEYLEPGSDFSSSSGNTVLEFGKERLNRPLPNEPGRPGRRLRSECFSRPIRMLYDTSLTTSCLSFLVDTIDMYGIRTNHFVLLLHYFAYFDTYFMEKDMKVNIITYGKESTGKSVMMRVVSKMLCDDTNAIRSSTMSDKAMYHDGGCTGQECDKAVHRDDISLARLCEHRTEGHRAEQGDEWVATMKEGLTSGQIQRLIGHINDRGFREQHLSCIDYTNVHFYMSNDAFVLGKDSPMGSRFHCVPMGGSLRADGAEVDLLDQNLMRSHTESQRALREHLEITVDFFRCMDYIMFCVIKAISTGAIADVCIQAAEHIFARTAPFRKRSASYVHGRQDRAKQRFTRTCRILTIYTRVMQLYFVEGSPFWNVPFDLVRQMRHIEATLVCDEQIAVFAFSLLKDEYFDPLVADVTDAIYRIFVAPMKNKPMVKRGNMQCQRTFVEPEVAAEPEPPEKQSDDQRPSKRARMDDRDDPVRDFQYTIKWSDLTITKEVAIERLSRSIMHFMKKNMIYGFSDYKETSIREVVLTIFNTPPGGPFMFESESSYKRLHIKESVFNPNTADGKFVRHAIRDTRECLQEALKFKHVTPGLYILGTPMTFMQELDEKGKENLNAEHISCQLNQFPERFIIEAGCSTGGNILNSGAKQPSNSVMDLQFKATGVKPVARESEHGMRFDENIVVYLQRRRLRELGIDDAEARRMGVLLGPVGAGDAPEHFMERLSTRHRGADTDTDGGGPVQRLLPSDREHNPLVRQALTRARALLETYFKGKKA